MKKKNLYAILSALIGIIFGVGLTSIGLWPVAIVCGTVCAIIPIAVILEKFGIIELVDATRYNKIVDKKGNVTYDGYESSKSKNMEKQPIFEQPFPKLTITEKTREDVLKHPNLYANCGVRIRMGKFYTDEEKEKYFEETLKRPLPGEERSKSLIKRIKKHK